MFSLLLPSNLSSSSQKICKFRKVIQRGRGSLDECTNIIFSSMHNSRNRLQSIIQEQVDYIIFTISSLNVALYN